MTPRIKLATADSKSLILVLKVRYVLTYIISRAVSKLPRSIDQIFAFDRGVPLFNAIVQGIPLKLLLRKSASEN